MGSGGSRRQWKDPKQGSEASDTLAGLGGMGRWEVGNETRQVKLHSVRSMPVV